MVEGMSLQFEFGLIDESTSLIGISYSSGGLWTIMYGELILCYAVYDR